MYEVKNSNFSFKKKSYVETILQKVWVEERATEKVRPKNVIHKGEIVMKREEHKKM